MGMRLRRRRVGLGAAGGELARRLGIIGIHAARGCVGDGGKSSNSETGVACYGGGNGTTEAAAGIGGDELWVYPCVPNGSLVTGSYNTIILGLGGRHRRPIGFKFGPGSWIIRGTLKNHLFKVGAVAVLRWMALLLISE